MDKIETLKKELYDCLIEFRNVLKERNMLDREYGRKVVNTSIPNIFNVNDPTHKG